MTTVESRYDIIVRWMSPLPAFFSHSSTLLAFRKVTKKRAKKEISEKIQKILCTNGVSLPRSS